jgi:uncharacterized membrane protein
MKNSDYAFLIASVYLANTFSKPWNLFAATLWMIVYLMGLALEHNLFT